MQTINFGVVDGLLLVEWVVVVEKLQLGLVFFLDVLNACTTWLVIVNQDGSFYVTAVGVFWVDGIFWRSW